MDLLALPRFGAGTGLHRVAWLVEGLLPRFDAIKITGSNGKGSVSAMTDTILRAAGVRTGLFTSPHLRRFNERIQVGGSPIGDTELGASTGWFEGRAAEWARLHPADMIGAFEAFTAIALHHFAATGVETLVLEAGIGGRFDPTRLVPGRVAALTSVDLEHTALLGATRELIAFDKADLCPPGGVLVLGRMPPEVEARLGTYAALRGISLRPLPEVRNVVPTARGSRFDAEIGGVMYRDLEVALAGRHQVENACVAIGLVQEWAGRDLEAAIRAGLANVVWPGRCEKIHDDPPVYIDVGHTPDGVATFRETLSARVDRPILLVLGASANKDVRGIVEGLAPMAAAIVCTRAHHHGADVDTIVEAAKACSNVPITRAETIEAAMAVALERARSEGMAVAVGGGLFLAIEAEAAVTGEERPVFF